MSRVSDPLQDAEQQADAIPGDLTRLKWWQWSIAKQGRLVGAPPAFPSNPVAFSDSAGLRGDWGAWMSYENFSAIKAKVQGAFDDVEAWIFQAFEGRVQDLDIDEDLELELAQRRRGMRFFAAGRARDGKRFASILFPLFQGDLNKDLYEEAFCDVLRVAGNSVKPGSRHKLSFRAGVLFFTADSLGNTYGVVASDDFPLANAFSFLEEMLQVYHSIDIEIAFNEECFGFQFVQYLLERLATQGGQVGQVQDGLRQPCGAADESLWSEPRFREDAFGIRELAVASWKKQLRPGDGTAQVQLSVLPLQEAL
eukprot:s4468_g12.t4